jgi:hypothetical protein
MRFIRPSAVIGPKGDRPPFGCCLLIWEMAQAAARCYPDRFRLLGGVVQPEESAQ